MRGVTHLAFAGLTGVVAAGFGSSPGIDGAAALAVGSLLPDIDTAHSGVGKFVKPVSSFIERKVGHRTVTHSFLGMAVFALGTSWLLLVNPNVWVWLLVGILTHLILDTANIAGVPLFWPWRLQFWMVGNRSWRVPYGSSKEFTWLGCMSLAAVALVPLSLDGFGPWFHRAMGTPYGAIQDYLNWRDTYEVWAEVKGTNLLTRESVEGRYRIIDALNREVLLVEDEAGRAYTVGIRDSVNISAPRVSAWKGEPIVAMNYRLDLSGRLVADFIRSLPAGAKRVYVTAALELKGSDDLVPALGYFERVLRTGNVYELRSATVGDLAGLSHLAIDSGSAVIRAEYSPGTEALANVEVAARLVSARSHVLVIGDLPSVSGIVVSIGERVTEGSLIARYVDDSKTEVNAAEVEVAHERIPELERAIELEREAHEARLEELRSKLADAQVRLEKTRYLVERDAAPRAELTDAEASHRAARQAEAAELSAWTSKLHGLESQIRAARLTILRAETAQESELERQWVRAPVSGLISDIRLTGVTTKGVNVEIIILEQGIQEVANADSQLLGLGHQDNQPVPERVEVAER